MVGGSLIAGSALSPVTPMAPVVGGILGIAAGASLAHGDLLWRMVAASGAILLVFAGAPSGVTLAGVAGLLGLGLAAGGPRGVRGAFGVVFAALVTLVAVWCTVRIGIARETITWPQWLVHGTGAAAMGIVGVLAMLPRHLRYAIDPVRAAIAKLPGGLDPEIRELCERSLAIWETAKQRLAETDAGRNLVRDGVLKVAEVAAKAAEVKLNAVTDAELAARMADLDQRIAAATDREVKTQYESARAALDDQKRYRDQIHQGRERLVARLHNHVAALEKFQLAATGLEATRVASTTMTKQLDELSRDVAASGEALAEVELGVTA